jgi:hypothetical protein
MGLILVAASQGEMVLANNWNVNF